MNLHVHVYIYVSFSLRRIFNYYSSKHLVFGEDVVSLSFSQDGKLLFAMQRRLPPCLYQTTQPSAAAIFLDEKGEYMNMVSMKSGCFVGPKDEVPMECVYSGTSLMQTPLGQKRCPY